METYSLVALHSPMSTDLYSLSNILWSCLVTCITIYEDLWLFNTAIFFKKSKDSTTWHKINTQFCFKS